MRAANEKPVIRTMQMTGLLRLRRVNNYCTTTFCVETAPSVLTVTM